MFLILCHYIFSKGSGLAYENESPQDLWVSQPPHVRPAWTAEEGGKSAPLPTETGERGKVTTYAAQILQEGMYIVVYIIMLSSLLYSST